MPKLMPREQLAEILESSPTRIATATAGLNTTHLHTPSHPGEWSLRDMLGHMQSCCDVWGGCINTILASDHPSFRAVNPTSWITLTD